VETYHATTHDELDYFTLSLSVDFTPSKTDSYLYLTLTLALLVSLALLYLVASVWLPRLTVYLEFLEEESLKPLEANDSGSDSGNDEDTSEDDSDRGEEGMQRVGQESLRDTEID
jgi:hypothetical protein